MGGGSDKSGANYSVNTFVNATKVCLQVLSSIVVSISARHAEDLGSIPGQGVFIPPAYAHASRGG